MALTKKELEAAISEQSGLKKTDTRTFLDTLESVVHKQLADGNEVVLPGIGKLAVIERAAKQGRNPQTGEAVQIPAKNAPKFTAAKALKDAVA